MSLTIAIVGGGFSGLLTAIHLLAGDPDITVRLIERAPSFGRGRAYATDNPDHLLNVRAANMSAFPDQPEHFLEWLAACGESGDGFVPRGLFGDYLQELLRETVSAPGRAGRFLLEQDAVVSIKPAGAGLRLQLALGRSLDADAVVLAVGLSPPAAPGRLSPGVGEAPGYVADPWAADLRQLPAGDILLLGAGLTMVDVAASAASPTRRLTALSRRGLLARVHGETTPAPPPPDLPAPPLQAMRILRRHADEVGWRAAVDSIRAQTPAIWRSWSLEERRRFLRHLRPWWDAHRHRMAPRVGARINALLDSGALAVRAGRLEQLDAAPGGFEARIRARGAAAATVERYAAVVNCAGLTGDLEDAGAGVLADLARQGLLTRDPLGLGVLTDEALRATARNGQVVRGLYVAGPLSRWANWESIAIPDLRWQTAELAAVVLQDLGAGRKRRRRAG